MGCTEATLQLQATAFHAEAVRLRAAYRGRLRILIGFETEWIEADAAHRVRALLAQCRCDFVVGSVHHVLGTPIDFDRALYARARDAAGGHDAALFAAYFDAVRDVVHTLRPAVVGHFDLVRLLSDCPDGVAAQSVRLGGAGGAAPSSADSPELYAKCERVVFRALPAVWRRIVACLRLVAEYGGVLEVNSSALRKGLRDPYPCEEICRVRRRLLRSSACFARPVPSSLAAHEMPSCFTISVAASRSRTTATA